MRILCIGDVVGSAGCQFLRSKLPALKRFHGVDLVICNGENSADGNGITPQSAQYLFDSGVDALTLGNHTFRRREVYELLDENPFIVRPANYPSKSTPGKGIINIDTGRRIVTLINLMGNLGVEDGLENAFECADRMLEQAESKIIIVDFHAETTSEKRAMGYYLDGRVYVRHTHPRPDLGRSGAPEGHGLHHRRGHDGRYPLCPRSKNRNNHQPSKNKAARAVRAGSGRVLDGGCAVRS